MQFFETQKEKRKLIFISVMALCFSIVMSVFAYVNLNAADEVIKVGVVDYKRLALREGPGSSYPQIKSPTNGALLYVKKGDQLVIVSEETNSRGEKWYKIPCSNALSGFAYVYDDQIENFKIYNIARDSDFEAYLTKQGFPNSYKDDLRVLHYFYPKWEFVAVHNGLDWNKCVDAEYSLGVSLVSPSVISSWKSTQPGAYNWETGKWKSFDYGLNAASKEIIEFYMDPRNFLSESSIFQFLGQLYDSSQTVEGLSDMLKGTFMAGSVEDTDGTSLNYPETIYNLSKDNGVNSYIISSIILNEVGPAGNSGSVSGNYVGYENFFNYFNILAYAHDGKGAIENGLIYASNKDGRGTYGRPWNTRYKAIKGGIQWYATNYVSSTQISLYTKRFNITNKYQISLQYMTNIDGAYSEAARLATAYPDTVKRNNTLKFYIPVYKNMPDIASKKPLSDGSPNNKLSSLSVSGYSIGPEFNTDILEYSLIVPSDISSVSVSAVAYDSKAKISGTGNIKLNYGANNVKINVTAENGDVRTYTLVISRQSGALNPTCTTTYKIENDFIKGVNPSLKVSAFLSNFKVSNGTVAVEGKNPSDIVGTGDRIVIYSSDSSEYKSFTVMIYGDISGDGEIKINDSVKLRNHLLGVSKLTGVFADSADVNRDGSIKINDSVKIRNHLLGVSAIEQ